MAPPVVRMFMRERQLPQSTGRKPQCFWEMRAGGEITQMQQEPSSHLQSATQPTTPRPSWAPSVCALSVMDAGKAQPIGMEPGELVEQQRLDVNLNPEILLEWGVWGLGAGEMTMMVQRMRPVAPMKVEDVVGLSPIADVGTGRPDPGHVLQIHPTEVGDVVPWDPMDPGCAHARDLETMVPRGAYNMDVETLGSRDPHILDMKMIGARGPAAPGIPGMEPGGQDMARIRSPSSHIFLSALFEVVAMVSFKQVRVPLFTAIALVIVLLLAYFLPPRVRGGGRVAAAAITWVPKPNVEVWPVDPPPPVNFNKTAEQEYGDKEVKLPHWTPTLHTFQVPQNYTKANCTYCNTREYTFSYKGCCFYFTKTLTCLNETMATTSKRADRKIFINIPLVNEA